LREIPIEVVNNGGRSVTTYIDKIMATNAEQEIYRRKICVVGHAKFGKTSLAKSIADNRPCGANRDEHQTVDIDRIHMSFLEEDGETAGRRHDVTFWDYAGQPVYQTVQSVFFSKRTLYLLCVDLHEYETKLNETLPHRDKYKMIQRYLSDHVFRWARLVLMRQPDALFAIVGTKRDQVQGDEGRIRNDFKRRLNVWAAGVREDAQKGINTGTILDTTTYKMLEASLNRMQHEDAWLTVSTLEAEDVRLARKAIEKIIIRTANERSFLMPTEYTQVLSAIHDMQTTVNGMADGERLDNAITISDDLVLGLQGASSVHTIDDESCRNILHTLHDLGDILWFEQERPEALRGYVIIEPTIVIDVVREVVNHNRSEGPTSEASAVWQHGKLDHEQLRQSPLWGVMDKDLLLAFKQLLNEFLLAYPAGGTMVCDSHLIVPAFRKANSSFGSSPLIKQQSSLRREGLSTNSFVRWDYAVSNDISDTLFNEFAAASYNDKWKVHAGPDCIQVRVRESAPKDYTFQASIERGADLTDTIRLEVAAAESRICWLYLKWFVLKMQYVLQGYPGLKSLCHIFDPQAGVPDTGITLENAREQAAQLHSSVLLPDLSWYKPATRDEIREVLTLVRRELDGSISDVKTEPDGLEAVKKLIVTRGECDFPSLWIFKYNTEAGLGEVRILSDVSGICHHEPLEIKIPPGSLAKYESWIKVSPLFMMIRNCGTDSRAVVSGRSDRIVHRSRLFPWCGAAEKCNEHGQIR
jgi:GTPase SAR1 family protein